VRIVNIGLIGLGTVGTGVAKILTENQDVLFKKVDLLASNLRLWSIVKSPLDGVAKPVLRTGILA